MLDATNRITVFFFFNATAPTKIYTLSLHDALPIPAPKFLSCWCSLAMAAPAPPPIPPHVAAPTKAAWFLLMTPVQLVRKKPSAVNAKYLFLRIPASYTVSAKIFAKSSTSMDSCQGEFWEVLAVFGRPPDRPISMGRGATSPEYD